MIKRQAPGTTGDAHHAVHAEREAALQSSIVYKLIHIYTHDFYMKYILSYIYIKYNITFLYI